MYYPYYSANECGNQIDDTTILVEDGSSNPSFSEYAWFCGNKNDPTYTNTTKPVGLLEPNGFGLFDIHGNIWEWTTDWQGCSYPNSSTDPYCDTGTNIRIIRSGYWGNLPSQMENSARDFYDVPLGRSWGIGARLVRSQ